MAFTGAYNSSYRHVFLSVFAFLGEDRVSNTVLLSHFETIPAISSEGGVICNTPQNSRIREFI